jgi:hypothetical protein
MRAFPQLLRLRPSAESASIGANRNTVQLQGNMVGQTITLCRLPGSGRDRPRKAMVCFDE